MAKRKPLDIQELDTSDHPDDGGNLKPGPGKESFKLAAFWKDQVEMLDQAQARWLKRGNTVLKRYRDERNKVDEDGARRMNLLWANTKVMKPAIYSKCPTPIVDRKFLDRDPTGRLSSMMLERSLTNEMPNNFHSAVTMAVYDRLLPGRGIAWIRYEPSFGEGPSIPAANPTGIEDPLFTIGEETGDKDLLDQDEAEQELETTGEQVVAEKIVVDYVDWRDFKIFPAKARTWEEVQAIGKKVHISKQEAKERFGEEIGKKLQPDTTPMSSGSIERQTYSDTSVFQDITERSIVVYEIWNKSDLRVYWVSTGYEYLCDVKEDPLKLSGFFPVPRPLSATLTNDTLVPVPDYVEWQDQAIQIDELTQRIAMLTKACKIAGVYNAANTAIEKILNETVENKLIPVDQWAMFADSGGLKGAIDFLPLEEVQSCIKTLQEVRQQCMIDLDQITGLSDIMRGTSDSRETLGGIRLKNNNAGTRLSESQEDVARFCRDLINIMAEIISKHFADETIIESSGILFEEELQPDVVLREWEAAQPEEQEQPQPQRMPAQAMGGGPQPGMPPMMGGGAPMPQGGPPMPSPMGGSPQPPMGGGNVVPFPGGGGMPPPQKPIPPDPQTLIYQKVQKAISLLRKDVIRSYRISIETDSTIFGDRVQERQDATEFVGAISGAMQTFEPIVEKVPEAAPLLAKMLQWAVRKYRTGRDLESEIDSFCVKMEKKAKQAVENPPPDPEQQKADAEIAQMKAQADLEAQNDQRESERQAQNDQRDFQMQQAKDQREAQRAEMEAKNAQEAAQMEMEFKRQEHMLRMRELEFNAQHSEREHKQKMEQLEVQGKENDKKRAEAKRKASQPKKKAS